MNKSLIYVICPYCGNKFKRYVEMQPYSQKELLYCDIEETEGCDRLFAIDVDFKPYVKYYKMRMVS